VDEWLKFVFLKNCVVINIFPDTYRLIHKAQLKY